MFRANCFIYPYCLAERIFLCTFVGKRKLIEENDNEKDCNGMPRDADGMDDGNGR